MAARGSVFSLLCLLLHTNLSLPYSLKNCTIYHEESSSAEVSLDCANRKLVTIPDDILKDAVSVKLGHNLIQRVHQGDFCGMSKLKILDLEYNLVVQVDDGSFTDLVSLEALNMGRNRLTNLTSNVFQGLSSLTALDLSQNRIQFIHDSAFRVLTSLQSVNFQGNMLQRIVDIQPILQLPQIHTIDLTYNLFYSFETKDLHLNFSSSLKELSVHSHKLIKFGITTPIFPHLHKLYLSMSSNSSSRWDLPDKPLLNNVTHLCLDMLPLSNEEIQEALQTFDSIYHLRLHFLHIQIRDGLLAIACKIPTLRKLDLSEIDFSNYTLDLAQCSQLTDLDLSICLISELPQGSLDSMRQIRFFNMSYNKLIKIPHDIRSLSSLEILIMNDNSISQLGCEDFVNTTHLTELHLNGNRIAKLQRCVMESLTNLKLLNLSDNLLVTFRASTKVGLQKLEILDLSQNFIKFLNNYDFRGLRSLKHLNVTSYFRENVKSFAFLGLKSLKSFSGSFPLFFINLKTVPQLEKIQVNFNFNGPFRTPYLKTYEDSIRMKSLKSVSVACRYDHQGVVYNLAEGLFHKMKHLEYFKAENVYLSAPYSDTFQFNQKLRSLIFTKTDLSELQSELFLPIPNLESLDLSESQLKSLDFLVHVNLSALRYLKLTGNQLNVINKTVFQSLPSLTFLDLDKNPFTCECSNADFIQWVKSNTQTQVVNAHQYECSFPVSRQGSLLLDFNFQSCLDDGGFLCFISSSCLVVLTLLSSFIYHFLRWHLTYTFHLLLAFLYNSRKGRKRDLHQFDAFVSYNVRDEGWVYREMLPVLEGQQGWRLCLHHRDFQPGKPIIENITDAIYGSRKTICVISRSYLQSEWCSREIQMASFRLFDDKKDVLILLFLEEIPAHQLSPYYRMRKLVKKRTYLSWPQAAQHPGVFWQNVQRALQTGGAVAEDTDLLTGPEG
ncbi:toll-like receptor 13 isoform X1 [Gambusia affinis]|uniref:toll-like receptor 13 isoform X1 n=1 Tax=Gambusia affinis TaxID=33528 RepID=UPI001CDC69BC|nr:toll-like receptor 13 isoform X1 [Gambusia affinis]